jgi:hypothetical protein
METRRTSSVWIASQNDMVCSKRVCARVCVFMVLMGACVCRVLMGLFLQGVNG